MQRCRRDAFAYLMTMAALTFVAVVAACFNPPLEGSMFRCVVGEPGNCPEWQTCVEGRCRDIVTNDAAAMPSSDAGPVDLAQAPTDQSMPGCRVGGDRVGNAWACPGTFVRGGAAGLCSDGFVVCKTAAGVDTAACNKLSGFFVSQALGRSEFRICRNIDPVNFLCSAPPSGYENRMRFGCGTLSRPYALTACQRQCGSFDRTLDCSGSGADYSCAKSDSIADDANLDSDMGVLCCPGP